MASHLFMLLALATPITTSEVGGLVKEQGLAYAIVICVIAGLAVLFVAAALALWKVTTWCGKQLLIPLRNAALEHLRRISDTLNTFAANDSKQTEILGELKENAVKVDNRLARMEQNWEGFKRDAAHAGCPAVQAGLPLRAAQGGGEAR